MLVEDVASEWEADAKINRTEIGEEALRNEQLHSKYWKKFAKARRDFRVADGELRRLRLEKYIWYTQGPSVETRGRNWRRPPVGKVLKTEAERYVAADEDIIIMEAEVAAQKDAVDYLESILRAISYRERSIRDFIEWEKFTQGAR